MHSYQFCHLFSTLQLSQLNQKLFQPSERGNFHSVAQSSDWNKIIYPNQNFHYFSENVAYWTILLVIFVSSSGISTVLNEPDKVFSWFSFNLKAENHLITESVISTLLSERHLNIEFQTTKLYKFSLILSSWNCMELLWERELLTLSIEIKGILNTRLLTYVNFNDYVIIRPIDFISLDVFLAISILTSKDQEEFIPHKLSNRVKIVKLWSNTLKALDAFWEVWRDEYLANRERT